MPAITLAELGLHFFDISLSHWGQIMNEHASFEATALRGENFRKADLVQRI